MITKARKIVDCIGEGDRQSKVCYITMDLRMLTKVHWRSLRQGLYYRDASYYEALCLVILPTVLWEI